MKCSNCGEEISKDSNFCEKCGMKVTSNEEINIDVSDLGPHELDDLKPNHRYTFILVILVLLALVGGGIYIYYDLTKPEKVEEKKPSIDYQAIINAYGKAIETVTSDYLLDHELINSFDEIKTLVTYKEHDVRCDNTYINIDGSVYLSDCHVDGKKVDEIYGKKIVNRNACQVEYDKNDELLNFIVGDELISVYECENKKCGLYEPVNYNSCLDMIAVIYDGDDKYLYNYSAVQNVVEPMDEIIALKQEEKLLGFIIKDKETQKYGLIDERGTAKINVSYDKLGLISDEVLYSRGIDLAKKQIVACNDDKCGILDLDTGKEIVPLKYDNIEIANSNYYVVKEDKKYYLVNASLEKVINTGYDMIFAFDNILIVNDNNKLKIMDYDQNKLVADEIETNIIYKDNPVGGIFGYNATKVDNDIIIEVDESTVDGYAKKEYVYHIETKVLEEK